MRVIDELPRIAERSLGVARKAGSLALTLVRRLASAIRERTRPDQPPPWEQAARRPPVPRPEPDREAVVVAQSADPGATSGGPGAQIRVDEPWDGYGELTAKQVIAELPAASPAVLAVVRMYEAAHRNRRTVIGDVDRRLASDG